MHLLDWLIIRLPLLLVPTIGILTQRHMIKAHQVDNSDNGTVKDHKPC